REGRGARGGGGSAGGGEDAGEAGGRADGDERGGGEHGDVPGQEDAAREVRGSPRGGRSMNRSEVCPDLRAWRRFHAGDVSEEELECLAAHQETCARCRAVLASLDSAPGAGGQTIP